jgi:Flp pilus assembly protein TadD
LGSVDPIATQVSAALGSKLEPPSQRGPGLLALQSYLEGKKYLEGWDVGDNYTKAAEAFSRAIEQDEQFAEAHAALALALWKSYQESHDSLLVEHAEREARRAVSLAPSLPEAHLALGVLELARGRPSLAEAAFLKAQRIAPADDAVCRRIAYAYAELGKMHEAEVFYQRAIDLRPTYWENFNLKGLFCMRSGDFEQAKRMFRRVIELRPESDVGYTNLAATCILAGEFREAEPLLEAALRINPTAEGHNNLGFVCYSDARFEEAAKQWRRAIELDPENPPTYVNLGDAYRHLGLKGDADLAYQRAVKLCEGQLKINPNDLETGMLLSLSLAGMGRCDQARIAISRSTTPEPSNPTFHYYAAIAHAICRDRAEAVREVEAAIKGGAVADVRSNPDLKPLLEDAWIRKLLR